MASNGGFCQKAVNVEQKFGNEWHRGIRKNYQKGIFPKVLKNDSFFATDTTILDKIMISL